MTPFSERIRSRRRVAGSVALLLLGLPAWAAASESARVGRIEISGNTRITAETIASGLTFKAGDDFDDAVADRALKALFATGLYRDVSISRSGETVAVRVEENPVVAAVTASGNSALATEAVLAAVTLKPGMPFTPAKAHAEASRIQALYRAQGRPDTSVEPAPAKRGDGRVDLAFVIREGAVKKIGRIAFIGNSAFSAARLKDLMATTEAGWLDFLRSSSTLEETRFAADRALILKAYRRDGYADATVSAPEVVKDGTAGGSVLQFRIEEGPRYALGPARIDSRIDGVDTSALAALVRAAAGEVYDADKLDAALDRIALFLAEHGPDFAEARLVLERDTAGRIVEPVFRIEPGKRLTVARVVVLGNRVTNENVIRRDLSLAEGKPFSLALARRDKARLERTGLFKAVDIQATSTPEPGMVRVEVIVTEDETRKVDYGIGYSSTEGITGDVAVSDNNLLGTGQRLKLSVAASEQRWQTSLAFTEPRLFDSEYSGGFDLLYKDADLTTTSSYQTRTYGGGVRVGVPLAEHLTGTVRYGLTMSEIHGVGPNASAAIREAIPGFPAATAASYLTSSIGTGLTFDDRDRARMPTSGTYLALSEDFAGAGGDVRYLRTMADARAYMPLGRDITLGARAVAGTIVGWGGDDVRLLDLFYKGGETVRGFAPSGIGPRDLASANLDALGGTTFMAATAEARFNLPYVPESTGLKGEVFADAGSLWGANKTAAGLPGLAGATPAPRASVGTGLVWDSPLGAFRLDYAVPVLKQGFDKTQALSFGMVP